MYSCHRFSPTSWLPLLSSSLYRSRWLHAVLLISPESPSEAYLKVFSLCFPSAVLEFQVLQSDFMHFNGFLQDKRYSFEIMFEIVRCQGNAVKNCFPVSSHPWENVGQ